MVTRNYIDPRVIKIAKRLHQRKGLPIPVPVDDLIREYAELHEVKLPFDVDGLCLNLKVPGKIPKVFIRPNGNAKRKRFTLAHELGHILIPWHTGNIIDHLDSVDGDVDIAYWHMEKEANVFASELLMPDHYMAKIISEENDIQAIIETVRDECDVSNLASIFRTAQCLPKNNILCVSYEGDGYRCHRSPGTTVGTFGADLAYMDQDDLPNGERSEFSIGSYNFVHWRFPSTLPLPLEVDSREWRDVFHECITSFCDDAAGVPRLKNRVSAIVAAVNSSLRKSHDHEEIYAHIIHRFSGDSELCALLEYPLFHQYVLKKIKEFISRR